MVFCFWPYVLSKLVSMACVAFKLPFYSVCRFQARFHGGYYSFFNFHSVLLSICFHGIRRFQVAFVACVLFQLVSLACVADQLAVSGLCRFHFSFYSVCRVQVIFMTCVTFKLFSRHFPLSSTFLASFVFCGAVRFPQPL